MNIKKFGEFIKKKRKEKKYTLTHIEELSKKANPEFNISTQYLSLLENGEIHNPNLEKIKLVGKFYEIDHILVLFYCLTGFENEDMLVTNFILEYIKSPIRTDTNAYSLKKDLLQSISAIIKFINEANTKNDLKELESSVRKFMKNSLETPTLRANDFILQASRYLDNLNYIISCLKITEESDYDLFIGLAPWFAKLCSEQIPEDRYIITNQRMLKNYKDTLKVFNERYFSYPGLRLYIIDEHAITSNYHKRNISKLFTKDSGVVYQRESKHKFELIDSDQDKINECEEVLRIVKSVAGNPVFYDTKTDCSLNFLLSSSSKLS